MTFYRVFPEPHLSIDEATAEGVDHLVELYRSSAPRLVRVNMIVTPQGKTVGSDNTSGSLSSVTDRVLVSVLRQMSDAVILGAGTLRQEKVPVPPEIPLVVVSRSGRVTGANAVFQPGSGELVVVTSNPDEAQKHLANQPHRLIAVNAEELDPRQLVDIFASLGWSRILLEGGQKTVTSFVRHSLVDDVCLTLTGAPLDEGSPPVNWWPAGDSFDLVQLLTDDNRMLYHRWVKSSLSRV